MLIIIHCKGYMTNLNCSFCDIVRIETISLVQFQGRAENFAYHFEIIIGELCELEDGVWKSQCVEKRKPTCKNQKSYCSLLYLNRLRRI